MGKRRANEVKTRTGGMVRHRRGTALPTIGRPTARGIAFIAAFACALVAASSALAAPTPRPLLLGFQDEESFLWSADRLANLDRAAAAHASVVRVIANWSQLAPKQLELLLQVFRGVEDAEIPADHLFGAVAEDARGSGVPCADLAVPPHEEDGVVLHILDEERQFIVGRYS